MSAIFGVVQWDGGRVGASDLDRMEAALAAHGPDRRGIWHEGHAGLGHRLSVSTPEDRFERQPLVSETDGGVLVADARIDNRDDLARAWSVSETATRQWPDSAFVARALASWGEDGPGRLRGAFALAHWDGRSQHLLLARSPFCERPLFYHSSPHTFAFASMPRGLFALGLIRRAIDEPFLADMLAQERPAPGGTYFRGVQCVPAGHVLIVTPAGTRALRFWRPDLIRELRLPTDEAYVDAFLEVYARAVRDAVRSAGPVGVMMSGGLDSSSVAAMAAPMLAERGERLAALTEVPPKDFTGATNVYRYTDETPFVEHGAALRKPRPFVRAQQRRVLSRARRRRYAAAEVPVRWAMNASWWDVLLDTARQQGVRVI